MLVASHRGFGQVLRGVTSASRAASLLVGSAQRHAEFTSFLVPRAQIRFSVRMSSWDAESQERLRDIVAVLRREGVVDMFERIITRVWKVNVDRYEPSELGDTNRSLGITASENIRTLVMRQSWAASKPVGLGDSVRVSAPNDSLLVEAAGVRLHVLKSAPAIGLAEPRWDTEFAWTGESDVRLAAAAANTAGYNPYRVEGGLFEDLLPAVGNVQELRETFLVWAGGSESPFTGGWLGLPALSDRPWLAVENLWWHGADSAPGSRREDDVPGVDVFSDKAVPRPLVSVKMRPRTAQQ